MNVKKKLTGGTGVGADHEHYKWWALSCTSLGMLLVATNSGTLIIALPDLERSLGTTLLQLVWVILAYMIASTVLVLTAGRLSDLFGRKLAFAGGFLVFAAASLAGAGVSLLRPRHAEAPWENEPIAVRQAVEEAIAEEIEAIP